MKFTKGLVLCFAILSLFCCTLNAQQTEISSSSVVVPRLVSFSSKAIDARGDAISGIAGITFAIYRDQYEGAPLWMETQNVQADNSGNYTVQLGATKPEGLPLELFTSGEARWLGVQVNGGEEQPRVLLLSVPYALKAADAQTVGGLPPTAFVKVSEAGPATAVPATAVSGSGTAGHVAKWAGTEALESSDIFDGSGNVGIGTTSPTAKLDVNGTLAAGPTSAYTTSSTSAAVTANDASSAGSAAVAGTSTNGVGVSATGVNGLNATGSSYGVNAGGNIAVYGNGYAAGLYGTSTVSTGVIGISTDYYGVYGSGTTGVYAISTTDGNPGLYAQAGAGGWAVDAYGTSGATGVLAGSDTGYAAWFNGLTDVDGNLDVAGTLTADTKHFKIDHPLDPANKYLEHASVESSEQMNLYTGNVITDAHGEATVRLPDWFEALNTDFRYQLTVIGQFAQPIIARKVENHQFQIRTNAPNVEVSWQITGVRHDAYAKAHPLQPEIEKPERERGFYRHPELYGAPEERSIAWALQPKAAQQSKQARVMPATNTNMPPVK